MTAKPEEKKITQAAAPTIIKKEPFAPKKEEVKKEEVTVTPTATKIVKNDPFG